MGSRTAREDYLKAVLVLERRYSEVRAVDLARYQRGSKPSVSHAVGILKKDGYLTVDDRFVLHLTRLGREVAEKIYERHCFFTEYLVAAGVDFDTAAEDACRIEHAISDQSFQRLKAAVGAIA